MFDVFILSSIFISLLAGQFARIELMHALANVYIHEFLLLFFIVRSMIRFGFTPVKTFFKSKSVLFFLSVVVISFLLSFREFTFLQNGIALLYLIRVALYILFGIYLFFLLQKKRIVHFYLYNLIYTFSILLLIFSAIQYIFFPNFWGLYALGWDPHMYRASAAYLDVFVAAALYGMLSLFWFSKKHRVLSVLFFIALVFSFSRSAYIAFAISALYVFIAQKKWKELFIFFSLFIVFLVLVPKPFGEGVNLLRTSSINSRILDYKLGLTLWQKKPLFGFGYNRIRFVKEQLNLIAVDDKSHSLSSFHSSFLIVLVTTGIVGFVSFLFLIYSLVQKYPSIRLYIVFLLSMSLFDNVFLYVLVMLPFIFIATQIPHSSFE